ncbi:hypothetical protein [Azospirillum sp. SYSU D00513]|uniref:hypothetical protein n=1 Tax=Azospirillum sp. SYSU D00513 TaxID=2812561 RepID=UPI001A95B0A1|nr:hypothetical protein [Azospirillum sp. SYSU D00513]
MPSVPKGSAILVAPAILWSAHFLFVYVFVSLACLWGWHEATVMGVRVVTAAVALATAAAVLPIALLGVRAWRSAPGATADPTDTRSRRGRFIAQVTAAQSALFAFSTIMVGVPTLMRPPCV